MSASSSADLASALQALLNDGIARNVAPGLVGIVFTPTDILTQVSAGVRNMDTQDSMDIDTTIYFASMSKVVNSLAALRLVEQTGFDIDSYEALVNVLPELKLGSGEAVSKIFDGKDETGKFRFKDAEVGVTLRHLMEHSSGFGYPPFHATLAEFYGMDIESLFGGRISQLNVHRLFESGTEWLYGISTDWIGLFVDRVSKKPLRAAYQDLVFTPLDVPSNTLDAFLTPKMLENRSRLHAKVDGENFVAIPDLLPPQYEGVPPEGCATFASGPLHGTLAGYCKIAQSVFGNLDRTKTPFLSDATWNMVWEDSIGARGISLPKPKILRSSLLSLVNDVEVFSEAENKESQLGEGWSILQTVYNREKSMSGRETGTLSWAGGANSYFFIDRFSGVGGIIAAQILPWAGKEMLDLRDAFEKVIYDHPEAWRS